MENDIEKLKQKVLDLIDPSKNYTIEDFDKEFKYNTSKIETPKIKLQFINKSKNPDPEYATNGSSGFDLRAYLQEPITIQPGKIDIIPTGLFFNIPENFEIQVRPRSGLAAKNGVTVLNTPGTIDADYTGELKVILINHGDKPFIINNSDRIAQAIFASVLSKKIIDLVSVNKIEKETERNSGGFGSTGIH